MTAEALDQILAEHNPIDRLAPLAEAKVQIFHLHGDVDTVVPIEKNSNELARRYRALGGNMRVIVIKGKGHEACPAFFQHPQLLEFFLKQGRGEKLPPPAAK